MENVNGKNGLFEDVSDLPHSMMEWSDEDVDGFYEEHLARQRYDDGFDIG